MEGPFFSNLRRGTRNKKSRNMEQSYNGKAYLEFVPRGVLILLGGLGTSPSHKGSFLLGDTHSNKQLVDLEEDSKASEYYQTLHPA